VLLRVDPATLRALSRRLGEATVVARDVHESRGGLAALLADPGSDDVARATGRFLDEWAFGARCFEASAATLARLLERAGEVYIDVDELVLGGWVEVARDD
jgi:hypothetical protein